MESQPGPLEAKVISALDDLRTAPSDAAAVELALTYARHIDLGDDLTKLGPALLATLTALGMTPSARAALAKGGGAGEPAKSPLDELRARRARRDSAAPVDTTAS